MVPVVSCAEAATHIVAASSIISPSLRMLDLLGVELTSVGSRESMVGSRSDSRLTTHDSRLATHDSRLTTTDYRLPTIYQGISTILPSAPGSISTSCARTASASGNS